MQDTLLQILLILLQDKSIQSPDRLKIQGKNKTKKQKKPSKIMIQNQTKKTPKLRYTI